MFARLFPLHSEKIINEAYDGTLSILCTLPITLSIRVVLKILDNITLPYIQKDAAEKYIQNILQQKQHIIDNYYVSLVMTGFVFPLIEEFLYRGLISPLIESLLTSLNLDPSYSRILTSMIFAAMHYTGKIEQFYLGLQFGNLVNRHNGSLWSSLIAHAFNNLLACISSPSADQTKKQLDEKINQIRTANIYLRTEMMNNLHRNIQVINEHWQKQQQLSPTPT